MCPISVACGGLWSNTDALSTTINRASTRVATTIPMGAKMKFLLAIPVAALMSSPAMAQSGYDFLTRDNPFGSAQNALPSSGNFGLCWTTGTVPNTKQVLVTNVFATQQTPASLEAEINGYERSIGVNVSFTCSVDGPQAQQARFSQMIASASQQGFDIGNVQVRPH